MGLFGLTLITALALTCAGACAVEIINYLTNK